MLRTERMTVADQSRTCAVDRDIELAITSLKRGAALLKYGRRGKPKFCPFRLANDESVLMWFSGKEEKHLKISQVSRIVPGQRTPIFQRYPRPEKEYQSFSLIYNDRSLDLVEDRSRKAQLQEIELETITKQLKEAIIIAREETSKREAAKEVIKLLTGQLKDMAERVSIGSAATESKSPPPPPLTCSFTPKPSIDLDSNSLVRYNNGSSTTCSSRPLSENRREGESYHGTEWVEQDEPGVYITLVSLPGGVKDLKRVRFSRKQFSEKEAEQWWAANKSRVQQQYKVPAAH